MDWDALREAVELLQSNPNVARVDSVRNETNLHYKVYRVTGDIIRIDILPKENLSGSQDGHPQIRQRERDKK